MYLVLRELVKDKGISIVHTSIRSTAFGYIHPSIIHELPPACHVIRQNGESHDDGTAT